MTDNITCRIVEEEIIKVELTKIDFNSEGCNNIYAMLDAYLEREDLTDQVDGIIDIFTTPTGIYGTIITVWLNGMKQRGIIKLSNTTFQFPDSAPEIGDTVEVEYIKNPS